MCEPESEAQNLCQWFGGQLQQVQTTCITPDSNRASEAFPLVLFVETKAMHENFN